MTLRPSQELSLARMPEAGGFSWSQEPIFIHSSQYKPLVCHLCDVSSLATNNHLQIGW